jgi:hypothetical protein
MDQNGVDSLIQASVEWGCREKESVHHRFYQGYDTLPGVSYVSLGIGM